MSDWFYVLVYVAAAVVCASLPKSSGDRLFTSAGSFSLAGVLLPKLGSFTWQVELFLAATVTALLMGFVRAVRYARQRGYL